jgi:hypothetical protein
MIDRHADRISRLSIKKQASVISRGVTLGLATLTVSYRETVLDWVVFAKFYPAEAFSHTSLPTSMEH